MANDKKRNILSRRSALSTLLVAAIAFAPAIELVAQQTTPNPTLPSPRQLLTPAQEDSIERIATVVGSTIVLQADETVGLKSEQLAQLSAEDRSIAMNAVRELQEGHIGIAVRDHTGPTRIYGNSRVGSELFPDAHRPLTDRPRGEVTSKPSISSWWDGYGYALYFDPTFTARLKNFDSAAIGYLIGLMVATVCSTVVGCLAAGVVTGFFWNEVWQWLDRQYFCDSLIIHIPTWNWVYVQPFKAGAWFDGRWFRTWLWT